MSRDSMAMATYGREPLRLQYGLSLAVADDRGSAHVHPLHDHFPIDLSVSPDNVLALIGGAGACRGSDPDAFITDDEKSGGRTKSVRAHERMALRICGTCPVKAPCLSWALEHHEQGVWGGTTTADRKRIRTNLNQGRRISQERRTA